MVWRRLLLIVPKGITCIIQVEPTQNVVRRPFVNVKIGIYYLANVVLIIGIVDYV